MKLSNIGSSEPEESGTGHGFRCKRKEYTYSILRGDHEPSSESKGKLGDIYEQNGTRHVWVRVSCVKNTSHCQWDRSYHGRPHPDAKVGAEMKLCTSRCSKHETAKWMSRNHFNMKRTEGIGGNPHPPKIPSESNAGAVTAPRPLNPPPQPNPTIATPHPSEVPSDPAIAPTTPLSTEDMSAPELLLYLARRWIDGACSLSSVQRQKGGKILEALADRACHSSVRRLTLGTKESSTCIIYGSAKTRRKGDRPSTHMLLCDFEGSPRGAVRFGDSSTGRFDDNVKWPDFVDQRSQLDKAQRLQDSERIFAALDVPSTAGGFGRCGYSSLPFSQDNDCTAGAMSTTWTLPGYITLPHMDILATGFLLFHWLGDKLWVMFPATEQNMKRMGDIRLSMPTLEATLNLIHTLEGLEVMFLTEQDHMECLFFLLPNTIHMCLSFTESCHSGYFVYSYKFLSQARSVVTWELQWINEEMVSARFSDGDLQKGIVQEVVDSMLFWESLSKKRGLGAGKRGEIRDMVEQMRSGIEHQAKKYSISLK